MLNNYKNLKKYVNKKLFILLLLGSILFSFIEMFFIICLHTYSILLLESTGVDINGETVFSQIDFTIEEASLLMLIIIMLSGFYRFYYITFQVNFIYHVGKIIGDIIYSKNFSLLRLERNEENANSIKTLLTIKIDDFIGQYLLPILNIYQSTISAIMISLALLYINPTIFIVSIIILTLLASALMYMRKNRISFISRSIVESRRNINQIINDGIDNRQGILINNYTDYFYLAYEHANRSLRKLQGDTQILALTPKYIIETIVFLLIVSCVFYSSNIGIDLFEAMPAMVAFVFAAQKLLPTINLIYFSFTQIRATSGIAEQVFQWIEDEETVDRTEKAKEKRYFPKFPFNIKVAELSWERGKQNTDRTLSIEFEVGKSYKISGPSGSGKSALVKTIVGFNPIKDGKIQVGDTLIDEITREDFWENITYVPQNDSIFETSILENITLKKTVTSNDLMKVQEIIDIVGLHEIFEQNNLTLESIFDEQKSPLSGGQRQRLVLARALFNMKNILILDEAASALDQKSETQIYKSLIQKYNQDRIIIYISHNPTNISKQTMDVIIS